MYIYFCPCRFLKSKQSMQTLMKCSMLLHNMLHFIWIFTVCKSTRLGFSSIQKGYELMLHKLAHKTLNVPDKGTYRLIKHFLTLCIPENSKRVLLQTAKTQMKCSIILHFIRVFTVCKGKKHLQTKVYNFHDIFRKL